MTTDPFPPIPDQPMGGTVSRRRLSALAGRVGPSMEALRRRPWAVLALVLLFLGLVTALGFQRIVSAVVHARPEAVVPDLTGKTLEQALDILSPLKLSLTKEAVEFNENFPSGAVLRQAPPPGLKVREGKVVRVTLSSGGQVVFIPELANKPLAEVQNLLRSAGLAPGALTQAYSQLHEAGWVIEQSPAAGAVGQRGQMVDLRISKGAPPEGTLLMPDFVNKSLALARQWVDEKGLKAEVKEELHSDLLPGLVISQVPPPDAQVSAEEPIRFLVSRSTAAAAAGTRLLRYQVPAGTERVQVRIVMRDEREEREVFEAYQDPGSLVEAPVAPQGLARARIFVNGVLIEERILE